jgi:hypothetical protein
MLLLNIMIMYYMEADLNPCSVCAFVFLYFTTIFVDFQPALPGKCDATNRIICGGERVTVCGGSTSLLSGLSESTHLEIQ